MKITKEVLKRIIKEELEVVVESNPLIYGLGVAAAAKHKRAAAGSKKAKAEEEERRKREYERARTQGRLDAFKKTSSTPLAEPEELSGGYRGFDPEERFPSDSRIRQALDDLLRAKHKAIEALGLDEDGDLPYMYRWGAYEEEFQLERYYSGGMEFQSAMNAAIDAGAIRDRDIDDESGGFYLGDLFPGQ